MWKQVGSKMSGNFLNLVFSRMLEKFAKIQFNYEFNLSLVIARIIPEIFKFVHKENFSVPYNSQLFEKCRKNAVLMQENILNFNEMRMDLKIW